MRAAQPRASPMDYGSRHVPFVERRTAGSSGKPFSRLGPRLAGKRMLRWSPSAPSPSAAVAALRSGCSSARARFCPFV